MFAAALFAMFKKWKPSKCPSSEEQINCGRATQWNIQQLKEMKYQYIQLNIDRCTQIFMDIYNTGQYIYTHACPCSVSGEKMEAISTPVAKAVTTAQILASYTILKQKEPNSRREMADSTTVARIIQDDYGISSSAKKSA